MTDKDIFIGGCFLVSVFCALISITWGKNE
ncbi:hypothetical protein CHY23_01719 [Actinobacillus pleuropneumoniae]|nr:hypothetical protein CHY23_01719 [Actinobacillus pleuropneumoniae]